MEYCRITAATAVACRPRGGTRGMRPDFEAADRIEPGDAATTGADCVGIRRCQWGESLSYPPLQEDALSQARECKMSRPVVKTQRLTHVFSYARLGSHAPTQSQLRRTTTN